MAEIALAAKTARVERGISQFDLAHRAGCSLPTIHRFESGRTISSANMGRILAALGLTLSVSDSTAADLR